MEERIKILDNTLLKIRGYISKLPKNNKVVVIFSGGLDSVTTVSRAIIDFDLEVFPVSFIRGQSNIEGELESIKFFNRYFKKRFGLKYHPVKILKTEIPLLELKDKVKTYSDKNGYPLRDNLMELLAIQYAISLWEEDGQITSILTGIVPEDIYLHSSLISLRTTTIMACASTTIQEWNISSLNVDPYLYGNFGPFSKSNEIKWCYDNQIPIHKSRTCNTKEKKHCGNCSSCLKRHKAFEKAGVPDQTDYLIKLV